MKTGRSSGGLDDILLMRRGRLSLRLFAMLLLPAIVMVACEGGAGDGTARSGTRAPGDSASVAEAPPDSASDVRITADGIGVARPGMTVGDVRSQLPAGASLGELNDRFMVDLVALPVHTATDTLYYLVFPADEQIADSTRLALVVTTNERVRTEHGVGPGTTLAEAARMYGPPTLSYSIYDESREYASFPAFSSTRIRFRVAPSSDASPFAGRYTTNAEFNETTAYDETATIGMVFVELRDF